MIVITSADLANWVGADVDANADALSDAVSAAMALVDQALLNAWREVPDPIRKECYKRTAVALFRGGTNDPRDMVATADGTFVPGQPNDPLQKAWPLIKAYTNYV